MKLDQERVVISEIHEIEIKIEMLKYTKTVNNKLSLNSIEIESFIDEVI